MKSIVCFGDSNTHGSNPAGGRHPREDRWPGVLQALLGEEYYVIEEGLGGRTTVFEDPLEPDRCGLAALGITLKTHKPIDLIILSLGTNDMKFLFNASAKIIARGMEKLVTTVKQFDAKTKILILSPIHIGPNMERCPFESFDESAPVKSYELSKYYQQVAQRQGCLFFDAASVAHPSALDQLHMDKQSHMALAEALAELIPAAI